MSSVYAYEREPYRTEMETRPVRSGDEGGRHYVVLEDTLFFPAGGGQPSDGGLLAGEEVLDVRREGDEVRHFVARAVGPGPVRLELDWSRRYDHMQQHTAQHLLTAIALERFGWATTAFHLGEEQSDVELAVEALSDEDVESLEEAVVAAVREARPIRCRRVSPEEYATLAVRSRGLPAGHDGEVRLVEIEGIDLNTCGGTHLRSTAEIETVKLLGSEPMRGGRRLHWLAGRRVRRRLARVEERQRAARRLFECSAGELVEVATGKLDALRRGRRRERELTGQVAELVAERLAASPPRLVEAHVEGAEPAMLQQTARQLVELAPDKVGLLTTSGDAGAFFALAVGPQADLDLGAAGAEVAGLLDGRGGGSKGVYQGKAGDLRRRAAALRYLERETAGTA